MIKNIKGSLALAILLVALAAGTGWSVTAPTTSPTGVPYSINIQGKITTSAAPNTPPANGKQLEIFVVDSASYTISNTITVTLDKNGSPSNYDPATGIFNIKIAPTGVDNKPLLFNDQYNLWIKVVGESNTAIQPLTSAPYAVTAKNVYGGTGYFSGVNPIVTITNTDKGFQGIKLNTSAGWQTAIGTNQNAGYWYDFSNDLGTTHQLYFNGTNWIFPTGKVGIGAATPDYNLHVMATAANTPGYITVSDSTDKNFLTMYSGAAGDVNTALVYPAASTLRFGTWDKNNAPTAWLEKMRIGTNGSVGIGMITPGAVKNTDGTTNLLEVAGAVNSTGGFYEKGVKIGGGGSAATSLGASVVTPWAFDLHQSDWGTARPYLKQIWGQDYGDTLYLGATGNSSNSGRGAILIGSNAVNLLIGRGTDSGTGLSVEHMRVDYNGNVAIGTNKPGSAAKLTVADAAYPTISLYNKATTDGISSLSDWGAALAAGNYSDVAQANDVVLRANFGNLILSSNATSNRSILFTTRGASGAETAKMVIKTAGNVGIGTTSPNAAYALDVAGAVNSTGGFFKNGVEVGAGVGSSLGASVNTPYDFQMTQSDWGTARPFFRRGWNGTIGDFTYIGSVGNSSNTSRGAMLIGSSGADLMVGRGSDSGLGLSVEHMRLDTSGNLGITGGLFLAGNLTYPGGVRGIWSQADAGTVVQGSGTVADVDIVNRNGAPAVLVLPNSQNVALPGNVAIGTTTAPGTGARLHLAQNDGAVDAARGAIVLSRWWASDTDTRAGAIYNYHTTGNNTDQLCFGVSGDGGSYTSPVARSNVKMVIQANGNVGIGSVIPSSKLQVNGNIAAVGGTVSAGGGISTGGYEALITKVMDIGDVPANRDVYCNFTLPDPTNCLVVELSATCFFNGNIMSGTGGFTNVRTPCYALGNNAYPFVTSNSGMQGQVYFHNGYSYPITRVHVKITYMPNYGTGGYM